MKPKSIIATCCSFEGRTVGAEAKGLLKELFSLVTMILISLNVQHPNRGKKIPAFIIKVTKRTFDE